MNESPKGRFKGAESKRDRARFRIKPGGKERERERMCRLHRIII